MGWLEDARRARRQIDSERIDAADRARALVWQDRMTCTLGQLSTSTGDGASNQSSSSPPDVTTGDIDHVEAQTTSELRPCLTSDPEPPGGTHGQTWEGGRKPSAHATNEPKKAVETTAAKKRKKWKNRWGRRVYEDDRAGADALALGKIAAREAAGREIEVGRARRVAKAVKRQIVGVLETVELAEPTEQISYARVAEAETLVEDERLVVDDLLAWKRTWELSDGDCARILLMGVKTWLKLLLCPRHKRISLQLSRKLRKLRVMSRNHVIATTIAAENGGVEVHKRAYVRGFSDVLMELRIISGEAYKNEAYTHGLWPGELVYYRYAASHHKRLNLMKKQRGCAVVHVPTGLAAECHDFLDFTINRCEAEGRLAIKIGWYHRRCQKSGRKQYDRRVKIRRANEEERYQAKRTEDRRRSRRRKKKQEDQQP